MSEWNALEVVQRMRSDFDEGMAELDMLDAIQRLQLATIHDLIEQRRKNDIN